MSFIIKITDINIKLNTIKSTEISFIYSSNNIVMYIKCISKIFLYDTIRIGSIKYRMFYRNVN